MSSNSANVADVDLTVVVPVFDGMDVLPRSVSALESSTLARDRWQLVIINDGSTDGAGAWGRAQGHRVIDVPDGPRGAANARNLGAAEASGSVLVFVDADVCVHPDTLERFTELFETRPELAAAFGTYDDAPSHGSFISQYRNLYHRFVHLRGAGDTETFWAGLGAVRRDVFLAVGGFDCQRFPRPQVEDIELGYRIRDAGHVIRLDPRIEATHLKRWTVGSVVRTDLFDRAIPWFGLLLDKPRPDSLNIGPSERVRTVLVALASLLLLVGALTGRMVWMALALALLLLNVISNVELYRWLSERRGWGFAALSVPMNLLYYLVSVIGVAIGGIRHVRDRVRRSRIPASTELSGGKSADVGSASPVYRGEGS